MLLGSSNGDHHHQQTSDGSGGEGGVQLKKGPWTAAEDAVLAEYVRKHGEGNWNAVQRNTGLARCGKSCRLRWANHLRPNLKKGAFSPEEERLIMELHAQLGNKWARMAAQLPGRTDNEIKNYWNTRVKRRHRQGMPLYPPEIQAQHQHQRIHLNHHHRSSHSHHSYHSQPTTPTTPTSSFSFPVASNSPTTPTGHHHRHFPPQSYSRSPTSSLPPTPPSLSPGLQSPHQPAFPTLTLFDTNNNNISGGGGVFNLLRTPPQLQNPPRFKRFHSDGIVTFSGHYNDNNNNIMSNNNYSFNSGNNGFHGGTSSNNNCSVLFSPFLRNPSSPSVLTSPRSNCNIPAVGFATTTSSSSSSKLLSFPSFSQMPVSFDNQHLPVAFYRAPDEKDCILTSTGSGFNLKQELPSSQLLSQNNGNAEIMGFENEKLSLSTSTGSGLLEDLLEQTQAGNYGESSTRASHQDNKSDFSGFSQWSESSCMNLSSGLEAKEETAGLINVPEGISKLLNCIPSEQVPDWYTDSGEASNCQSSVVTDANLGLEMHQLASIFCVDPAAAGHVTAPGSCSNYDNLPGIC